jgi:cobalamin biosynthesis protein CobT
LKAIKDGVARIKLSKEELYKKAEEMIKRARKEVELFMKNGLIKKSPKRLEL